MRRLLAATALAAAAALAPGAASAEPDLPCDGWVHGCYLPAYVQEACDIVDCGIIP